MVLGHLSPGPDLRDSYPIHLHTLINTTPTLVPYITNLIASYPIDVATILITYPTNLATLLITCPTNLTIVLTIYPTNLATIYTQPPSLHKYYTNLITLIR
jgi:hypothetical protein